MLVKGMQRWKFTLMGQEGVIQILNAPY